MMSKGEIVGSSEIMTELREMIQLAAPSHLPVLIEGETGVGKELVAAAIHRLSGKGGPFVALNICAISESMFEGAMFGHVRGAFTGAVLNARGFLAEANGGTLFLDEIGTLGLAQQAKLLRALETGVFRPIGAEHDVAYDFRVVSASNTPLDAAVSARAFRADLAFRLSGCVLTVPPLRERRSDIPVLLDHFMASAPGGRFVVSSEVMEALQRFDWPGNVRQLQTLVHQLSLFATRRPIGLEELRVRGLLGSGSHARCRIEGAASDSEFQRLAIVAALEATGFNTARAAERLGVHRGTLYRWITRLAIPLTRRTKMYHAAARQSTLQ